MMAKEKRWIILADDGRHSTIGRHTDPSTEELDRAGDALKANGLGGWLAILEGGYYTSGQITLMMVRELAMPRTTWEEAVVTFKSTRDKANALARPASKPAAPAP